MNLQVSYIRFGMHMCMIILAGFVIQSCSGSKNNQQKMPSAEKAYIPGKFDQQGHRGCRSLMPENTIPAMIYALGSPASTLEMDVVISRDQKVLLSHEPYFNHEISTGPKGEIITSENEKSYNIYRMDYDEVRRFDVGMKPHPRFPNQQKIPAGRADGGLPHLPRPVQRAAHHLRIHYAGGCERHR